MTALLVLAAWLVLGTVFALALGATVRLRELREAPRPAPTPARVRARR